MKLLVGLGNPGTKYTHTRHNVGFMFVDYLENSLSGSGNLRLFKPQHFMNNSGQDVRKELNFYKIPTENLIIIHDDLDLRLGEFKIQKSKGPKLHYGIESIEKALGTKNFWRVRIGVDNRDSKNRTSGETYVLQNFTSTELNQITNLFPQIWSSVAMFP